MADNPENIPVLDAHNDTLILKEVRGEVMDFSVAAPEYHADLPRMKKGGIQAAFVMVGDHDLHQSSRLIRAMYMMEENHPDEFTLCRTGADVEKTLEENKFALIMSIESQAMFSEDISLVYNWNRLGVRVASLTHGEGNTGGHSCALQEDQSAFGYVTPEERKTFRRAKGLTGFGRESLDAMTELNIPCDLAHTNDAAFWEVIEHGEVPVCYTHGNCYEICPHARNLTDEMMKALAQRGGVMGMSFYNQFIHEEEPNLERLADHFIHALEVMGEDHVGIGTDFDGMKDPVVPDAGHTGCLWNILRQQNVSEDVLLKIGYKNFLRLLP